MKSLKTLLCAAFAAVLLVGCSEEWLYPDGVDFGITESGEIYSSAEISAEEFYSKVAGHGWKCVDRREILEDGTLSKTDWTEIYYDGGGTSYFFDKASTVTSFFWIDSIPAYCYSTTTYSYDDSAICINDFWYNDKKTIVKLSGNKFSCIGIISYRRTGIGEAVKPIYAYFTYKRITDNEIQEYRENYTFDYAAWRKAEEEKLKELKE